MLVSRRWRELLLCGLLLALPVLLFWANFKQPERTNALDRWMLRLSVPVQGAILRGAEIARDAWRRYVYLVDVEADNERLLVEAAALRLQLREAGLKLAQLPRYERLLGFRQQRGIETVGARVVGAPSSALIRSLRLRIDEGAEAIRGGLAVVTADGVVGHTSRVYGSYAEVVLAADPKSAIDVIVPRTGARGVLRGIDGTDRLRCRVDYVVRDAELKVGDLVVTSGAAGVFPRDLPVGRVLSVSAQTHGLYRDVEVIPVVDVARVEEVLVILAPEPPRVEAAEAPPLAPQRRAVP